MGMSASQARFLALTARKSNVEFQGQQVNQQRTSLANESAGLFNQMLALEPPIPPSVTDYYNMAYTFTSTTDANTVCRIKDWGQPQDSSTGANYSITYDEVINDVGVKNQKLQIGTTISQAADGTYTITLPNSQEGIVLKTSSKDVNGRSDGDEEYEPSYYYENGGRRYYITKSTLENDLFNDAPADSNGIKTVTISQSNQVEESYYKTEPTIIKNKQEDAVIESDENGRFTTIKLISSGIEIPLNIQEVKDDAGYDEMMQKYNYEKMIYDRTIADINTRTEVIQRQDQNLELHLKQLDTEQEALKVEIDAVSQVINKNVENSFKTFA